AGRGGAGWGARLLRLVPGIRVWFVLTPILGASFAQLVIPSIGVLLGGAALAAMARRPALALLVPLSVAVELVANGLAGQAPGSVGLGKAAVFDPFQANSTGWFSPMLTPDVNAAAYARAGP